MSKASEWAAEMAKYHRVEEEAEAARAEAERNVPEVLRFTVQRHNGVRLAPAHVANVVSGGQLHIGKETRTLKPDEAIALARWILDTFEERS